MVLSDKKFIEFADRIWERNKELIEENRALKQDILQYVDRINKLKDELEFEKAFSKDSHSQNIKLRKELEEQHERIKELKHEYEELSVEYDNLVEELKAQYEKQDQVKDILGANEDSILADWDELFEDCEDDSESSDCFINYTFNINI